MSAFERNVFINCPFDPNYRQLLVALIFTIKDLGFCPRISLEEENAGVTRLAKIIELIRESKYGIHDLSRIKSSAADQHFRMNMPFELGIDYGCLKFKGGKWANKRLLVLEKESYRYQIALSDLAGSDIKRHSDDPQILIKSVRDWFVVEFKKLQSHKTIWYRFNDFMAFLESSLSANGYDLDDYAEIPLPEVMAYMDQWIEVNSYQ